MSAVEALSSDRAFDDFLRSVSPDRLARERAKRLPMRRLMRDLYDRETERLRALIVEKQLRDLVAGIEPLPAPYFYVLDEEHQFTDAQMAAAIRAAENREKNNGRRNTNHGGRQSHRRPRTQIHAERSGGGELHHCIDAAQL